MISKATAEGVIGLLRKHRVTEGQIEHILHDLMKESGNSSFRESSHLLYEVWQRLRSTAPPASSSGKVLSKAKS